MISMKFIINFVLPSFVLITGLIGNLFGYIIISRKKLAKIGPVKIYKYLFAIDSFYLIQIVASSLEYSYCLNLATHSSLSCKFYIYFNYSIAAISPWLLVYIIIERLISFKYPSKRFVLREDSNQIAYFILVFLYISLLYIPIPIYNNILTEYLNNTLVNSTGNEKLICDFISSKSRKVLNYYDLILRILIPSILMLLSSFQMISNFFQLRRRIKQNFLQANNTSRFKRDILFAITSLILNLVFIILNLPFSLILFLPKFFDFDMFLLTFFIYYASYGVNFYLMLLTNSLFRNEFISCMKILIAFLKNK